MAWAITGSGHYLKESLELARRLPDVDLFLSRAGEEILAMYNYKLADLRAHFRIHRDNTASAAPVGLFYHGQYHGVVIAPATSNTVGLTLKGASGDTGIPLGLVQPSLINFPASPPTTLIIVAASSPVALTEFIFC